MGGRAIYIISYALEMNLKLMVSRVFVVHFQVIRHIFMFVNSTGLTVKIHVSTKTCVTGNNLILSKALICAKLSVLGKKRLPSGDLRRWSLRIPMTLATPPYQSAVITASVIAVMMTPVNTTVTKRVVSSDFAPFLSVFFRTAIAGIL